MVELLEYGGVGYISDKKESGWIRTMFKIWNSLGAFIQSCKMDWLNYLIQRFQVDIIAGCENQCNWSMVDLDHQFLSLLAQSTTAKVILAHN